ncbi:hypothetical protein LTR95_009552 [Oleoguttula sp. CCFEE 5521]
MLSESELGISSKAVRDVLQSHATLVEEYRRLKSDYEEERNARERYKKLAKSSTPDKGKPFVVVLIDGDGYIFDNGLVSGGVDGGSRAAHSLNKAVRQSLRTRGLEDCRIIVRNFANVSGLSRALSKAKLAGPEKRSIAPFVASFNASNELFDFVDAGELDGNAASKMHGTFQFFEYNSYCRQIYFAGCHDGSHINDLARLANGRDRITLVRNYNIHPDFKKLGMRMEDFPDVFRATPLESNIAQWKRRQSSSQYKQEYRTSIRASDKGLRHHARSSRKATQSWRTLMRISEDAPFAAGADSDFMRGNRRTTEQSMNGASSIAEDFSGLPDIDEIPVGKLPVNAKNERLDPRHPSCTPEDRRKCNERISRHKLCNKYHLNDTCTDSACEYDHRPVSEGMRAYLKSVASGQPCKRKGDCRDLDRILGHVCQRVDCTQRGGKAFCKLPMAAHHLDTHVAHYVDGTNKTNLIDVDSPCLHEASGSQSPVHETGDVNGDSVDGITKADLARYFNRGNGLPCRTASVGADTMSHMDHDSDEEKAGAGIDASQIPW